MSSNIELSIQPAFNKGNKVDYAEVLVRQYGNIQGPQRILEYVKDTGMEEKFDLDILEETLKYIRKYPYIEYPIGMNLCSSTISNKDIGQKIVDLVQKYYINPKKLVIEINEQADFNKQITFDNIRVIRSAGVLVALDDFGVEKANLSTLTKDAFDIIKIDRTFVKDINKNTEHESSKFKLLKLIANLCKSLGTKSILEGVEDSDQLSIARSMGYDNIQGYVYQKPVPIKEYRP